MTETKTTVRELIEKLKEFDGDMEVVIQLYSDGYRYIKGLAYNIHIEKNAYNKGGYGISHKGDYVVVIE